MASKLYHVLSVSEFTFNEVTMRWLATNEKTEVIRHLALTGVKG